MLAGISATWYTYLEQGREIRASEQVLNALAEALRLDRHERAHLLQLAGHTAADAPEEREPLAPEAAAVPLLLQPNPAYIIDGNYDVLSHNRAADTLFPKLIDDEAERPANFVRWVFLEPAARDVVVDWEREARGLLARLRAQAGRHPADPRYTRLIDELNETSPEARAWWRQYDVQARHSGRKRLRPRATTPSSTPTPHSTWPNTPNRHWWSTSTPANRPGPSLRGRGPGDPWHTRRSAMTVTARRTVARPAPVSAHPGVRPRAAWASSRIRPISEAARRA